MSPIALTTEFTSPPGVPALKSQISAMNKNNGVSLDGISTPYSATSTAVSEFGDVNGNGKLTPPTPLSPSSPLNVAKVLIDSSLPSTKLSPTDSKYFTNLLSSSSPLPTTKAGATVYGSALEVLEAFAVQQSEIVWVYDDAAEVGFGNKALEFGSDKVQSVQTRESSGLELAGYTTKSKGGKLSVFATTSTLPQLVSSLESIRGNVIINLATTSTNSDSLKLEDSLFAPGVIKTLTQLPDDWEVVFSSGSEAVENAARLYGSNGKFIHVVESTFSGRETTSYTFPSPSTGDISFSSRNVESAEIAVVPSGHYSSTLSGGVVSLNTLSPSPDALASVLSGEGKVISVIGGTKSDADALKAVVLSSLYSASSSSSQKLPIVKSLVIDSAPSQTQSESGKTISFYTSPTSTFPQLTSHLFLSSPTLSTRLASFGSSSTRGMKSVLSLSPSTSSSSPLEPNSQVDVAWVNDANVLKSTDVVSSLVNGGILVLELPWLEEEVPVKLTRSEIQKIKANNIRVFLLDLDPSSPTLPIKEQVAFLLLYTGSQILPQGVRRVLDAFYAGDVGRDDIEEPQAGLSELSTLEWAVSELEEGKTEKIKSEWEWDELANGQEGGLIDVQQDETPQLSSWELAAKHILFREAFTVPDSSSTSFDSESPAISSLRPSTPDQTYLVTVSENRRLTPLTYDRNVFHLELDTKGTGLKYEIGEAIGIHGWNDTNEVLNFCSWYDLKPDDLVCFPNPLKQGTKETRTVFQLLQQNLDIFGRPGKAFYAALSKLATKKSDAMTLKFISAPEGNELFKKMAEKETVTFADVLYRFRTARPSIEELVGLIPEIKPRHYSIASSQKAVGDKVELLIVTVDWLDSKGSPRFGQCTRYLAALSFGDKVTVSIKPSVMKLPPHDTQPIIMAGLGTGAAPFRAFMQHRAWQRSQGIEVGPLLYYFGSRYRSQEYLYGEDIEAYIASGIISHAGLAFSRDGKDKVYIQHKMKQDKKLLSGLLSNENEKEKAYFYLCGPTWPVPDVYEALVSSLTEEKGLERKKAEEFIEELKEEERYVLEVY